MLRRLTQMPCGNGIPAVVEAAQIGCIEKVDLLVDAGAD